MMGSSTVPRASGEGFAGFELPDAVGGGDFRQLPSSDPRVPLSNLSLLGRKMDSLRRSLADSLDRHNEIGGDQLRMVSAEISSAVQQIILNGAALLAFSQTDPTEALSPLQVAGKISDPVVRTGSSDPTTSVPVDLATRTSRPDQVNQIAPDVRASGPDLQGLSGPISSGKAHDLAEPKDQTAGSEDGDCEIVELDAVEILAEHVHFCEICGKGFKRDANLRMHMRAHGNRFKTLEALSKPDHRSDGGVDPLIASPSGMRKTRFSCPFVGCNRNRAHRRFRPLKSVLCVKNHFKRSHCPKMYSCTRCNRKSFSVLADLRSHLKHCGECRWRCSCGTSFSRKDKLLGHMALFEGHMAAVVVGVGAGDGDEVEEKGKVMEIEEEEEEEKEGERGGGGDEGLGGGGLDPEFLEELMMEGFGTVDGTAWMDF